MKKKILTTCLVIALMATALIGGTLAYFTDNKSEVNTFTVGSVEIKLHESQLHRTNIGQGYLTATPSTASPSMAMATVGIDPAGTEGNTPDVANYTVSGTYFSDEQIKTDAGSYKANYFGPSATNIVPGRVIRKCPYVENTGNNPAYIRVRALVPSAILSLIDDEPTFWTSEAVGDGETDIMVSKAVTAYKTNGGTLADSFKKTRDGIEYYEFDFIYKKALEPKAVTFWNAWNHIKLIPSATAGQLSVLTDSKFDVIFEADAIQSEGFTSAVEAFAAFDAQ